MHIAIIGGGPGGYVAAIRAKQLGAEVTLIEGERLGGTCLNRGCIPTKALVQNAQVIRTLEKSHEFGVNHGGFAIDMNKIQSRKETVTAKLRDGIAQLIKSNGIKYVEGRAGFVAPGQLLIKPKNGEDYILSVDKIIIATGSVPAMPTIMGLDLPGVLNSNQLLEIQMIPKSMIVIGGGVIGMEFADIFCAFGTEITVVEFLPRILYEIDKDLAARLAQALRKAGIQFATDMRVKEIKRKDDGQLAVICDGKSGEESFAAEYVLVATGRAANTEGLNLDAIGVMYDKKGIKVDGHYKTNVDGVYAIGDVIGGLMLAHVASEEGKACAEHLMGHDAHVNYDAVPAAVFTSPEIAAVGLTQEQAEGRGINVSIGRFMFGANAKAVAMGEESGLIKVIAREDTKEIIGVHILGPHASDLIHEAALAVENKLTTADIARTIHAHPTLSEAFFEAVLSVEDRAIHMAPKRK